MKQKFNFGGTFRISVLLFIPVLIALHSPVPSHAFTPACVSDAVLVAVFLLLMYPLSYENRTPSITCSVILMLYALLTTLVFPGGCGRWYSPSVISSVVYVSYISWRTLDRVIDFKPLFRSDAPLSAMEDCARMMKGVAAMCLAVVSVSGIVWVPLILSSALFVFQYLCLYYGRTGIMGRERDETLRNIVKGDLRTSNLAVCDEDTRMSALYSRVIAYMEEKKPYLQDGFTLSDFARRLFTNHAYLSRVINYYSGRNFKQFVNYYRVKYSVELIKKDPHLTVMELATMSGFHSTVTYNMAFRINMNDTPASFSRNCPRD